jgi:outer membrane protein, multidrug efflux system
MINTAITGILSGTRTLLPAVLVACALTATPVAFGQSLERIAAPETIDLETAVALALQSNLGIESELVAVRQKKLIADTWWNRFFPSANVSYTMGRSNTEQTADGLAPVPLQPGVTDAFGRDAYGVVPFSVDRPRWFMSAGLDLSLVLTLQTMPGISLARLDHEMGLLSLEEARRNVERDVSKQFYDLLLTRERILLVDEQIATAQRRYDQAQLNYENGLIDEFSLLSAQVALENQRPGLAGLRVAYQQQLLAFRNSLGLPLATAVEPRGTIDPPDLLIRLENSGLEEGDRHRLRNRLDILQLEKLDLIQQEQVRIAEFTPQSGRAPFFRFGFNVDPTFLGDPLEDDWFDLDLWDQRSGAFTVSIVQPLDAWLPYSQTRNRVAEIESERRRNQLAIERALRGAEIRVRGLLLGIESSQQTIRALEENIHLARRAFELAEIGYENGLRELLEVQNAEVDLKDAEFQLLQEKKNIMDSILDLAFELNVEIETITVGNER